MKTKLGKTLLFLVLWFILTSINSVAYAILNNNYIEYEGVRLNKPSSNYVEGEFSVSGVVYNKKINILVTSPTKQTWYDIPIEQNTFNLHLWLTDGKGDYNINVMIHERDNLYRHGPGYVVKNLVDVNKYLSPAQYIESNDENIIDLSRKITIGLNYDIDKVRAIYEWVIQNTRYDMAKFRKHLNNDYNNRYGALNTVKTGKGVCFDYATLIAALGRAAGIKVKVIEGDFLYNERASFHAWNEIYISEEARWIKVDVTFEDVFGKDFFDTLNFDDSHEKISEF